MSAASPSSGRPDPSGPRRSTSSRRHRDEFRVVGPRRGPQPRPARTSAGRVRRRAPELARSGLDDPTCARRAGRAPRRRRRPERGRRLRRAAGDARRARAGKRLALANKESLIAAGPVVAKARAAGGGEIVPVDSEHSAVWQALRAGRPSEVARIILTASGGPFRGRTRGRAGARHARRRARAPDVEHGRQDHDRLVDADEQGPRSHRGPRAVRRRLRRDRRRRPPAVGRARHGRVRRRRDDRAALDARHATADRPRARRAGPAAARPSARSTGRRSSTLDVRAARPRDVPRPRPRLRCRPDRRHRAGRAERGQRGRGRGVPRRPHRLARDRRHRGRGPRATAPGTPRRSADVLDADRVARERAAAVVTTTEQAGEGSARAGRGRRSSGRAYWIAMFIARRC